MQIDDDDDDDDDRRWNIVPKIIPLPCQRRKQGTREVPP